MRGGHQTAHGATACYSKSIQLHPLRRRRRDVGRAARLLCCCLFWLPAVAHRSTNLHLRWAGRLSARRRTRLTPPRSIPGFTLEQRRCCLRLRSLFDEPRHLWVLGRTAGRGRSPHRLNTCLNQIPKDIRALFVTPSFRVNSSRDRALRLERASAPAGHDGGNPGT